MTKATSSKLLFSTIFACLAIIHISFDSIRVDELLVFIVLLVMLPWSLSWFKSIELPNGMKFEFNQKLKDMGEAPLVQNLPKEVSNRLFYAFEKIAEDDPNMIIYGFSSEVDSKIRELATLHGRKQNFNDSLETNLNYLQSKLVLTNEDCKTIMALQPYMDKMSSGTNYDYKTSSLVKDYGVKLIRAIDEKIGECTVPNLLKSWEKRDGAAVGEVGSQLSISLVKNPFTFLENMSNASAHFDSWIDGLRAHTFTIYHYDDEVDMQLWIAYHEKLKELMLKALRSQLDGKYRDLAQRAIEKISLVDIRCVW